MGRRIEVSGFRSSMPPIFHSDRNAGWRQDGHEERRCIRGAGPTSGRGLGCFQRTGAWEQRAREQRAREPLHLPADPWGPSCDPIFSFPLGPTFSQSLGSILRTRCNPSFSSWRSWKSCDPVAFLLPVQFPFLPHVIGSGRVGGRKKRTAKRRSLGERKRDARLGTIPKGTVDPDRTFFAFPWAVGPPGLLHPQLRRPCGELVIHNVAEIGPPRHQGVE